MVHRTCSERLRAEQEGGHASRNWVLRDHVRTPAEVERYVPLVELATQEEEGQ